MLCLGSVKFNMQASILHQGHDNGSTFDITDDPGEWVNEQDPNSGEIIRTWQPNTQDDPSTPDVNEAAVLNSFPCLARGIVALGIRGVGTTETFSTVYDDVEYVRLEFPASVAISKRDRVTNIRDRDGNIIWREEEVPGSPPTVYNVNGVTPIIDPFGRHTENFALLKRAERQQ